MVDLHYLHPCFHRHQGVPLGGILMIRMRDDDVLVPSRSWKDPFGRFRQVHEWIARCFPQVIHCPGIIIKGGPNSAGLEDFPECIEYIRRETEAGLMLPEYHAVYHVDPEQLSFPVIREHLAEGCDWIEEQFKVRPTRWYTPWGADSEKLRAAAQEAGLELVGVDKHWKLDRTVGRIADEARTGETSHPGEYPAEYLDGQEISFHWWEGGARVARLCAVVRHGSWEAAEKAERELFR